MLHKLLFSGVRLFSIHLKVVDNPGLLIGSDGSIYLRGFATPALLFFKNLSLAYANKTPNVPEVTKIALVPHF